MDTKYFFNTSVTISVPPSHVWIIMSDIEHWHLWTPSVRKIRRLDKGPITVGSKALIFQPKLPPAFWRVTAIEHERGFTWVTSGPGMSITGRHYIEPTLGGSKVTLSIQYNGILAPILSRLTAKLTDRYLGFEAAGLKKQSESTYAQ